MSGTLQQVAKSPHPAFAAMHAHLIGDPALATVAPRRLHHLYPVALESYELFFRRFYMEREQTSELYYKTPGWNLTSCLSNIELALITFQGFSAGEHDCYNAIFREEIPSNLVHLSDDIILHANSGGKGKLVHGGYDLIRLQMWPLLKAMYLMRHWDAEAFEQKLREDSKADFRSGLREIAKFYGMDLDSKLLA